MVHCLRLCHEKQRCPLLLNKKQSRVSFPERDMARAQQVKAQPNTSNLVDQIMPFLADTAPPGFSPSLDLVVPEVFALMKQYMDCPDKVERLQREHKMRASLEALAKDLIAQRSHLLLEAPLSLTSVNKGKRLEFGYPEEQNKVGLPASTKEMLAYNKKTANNQNIVDAFTMLPVSSSQPRTRVIGEGTGEFLPATSSTGFVSGSCETNNFGTSVRRQRHISVQANGQERNTQLLKLLLLRQRIK